MNKNKRLTAIILIMTFALALIPLFSGCEALLEGNEEIRPMAESYIDALVLNDFAAAEKLCPEFNSAEHKKYFDIFCASFDGASDYEIKQVGWNTNISNGVTYKKATYEIITDSGRTMYFEFSTQEGVSGLSNVNYTDSTDFIESTKDLWIVDIILKVISLAVAAFCVWMIVDCAKRAIPKKVLYIILILIWIVPGIAISNSMVNFQFHLGFVYAMSKIDTTAINQGITASIAIPVGALLYFFRRKNYPFKKDLAAQEAEELPVIDLPEDTQKSDNGDNTES